MDIVKGNKYIDRLNTLFTVLKINPAPGGLAITAKESDPMLSENPLTWSGSDAQFRAQFKMHASLEVKGSPYTFNSLDAYTNTELEGIRDDLRDKLSGEILRVQALKAEILFLCKEITKYKNA